MELRKKPGVTASKTGGAQAENGGIANSGVLNVENLYQCPPPAGAPSPEEVAAEVAAYARQVLAAFGRLDLEVMTPLSEQGEHPVIELREVFVPPLVRADPPPLELPRELMKRLLDHGEVTEPDGLPPGADRSVLDRVRQAYQQRPPVPVLDVLAAPEAERVVLLGDPGAGKSTLARYLALALTGPVVPEPLGSLAGLLPVVVELRRYADERWRDRTFEDFLEHLHAQEGMSVSRPVLEELLRRRRVVMVFDGLDELFDPVVRTETARRVSAFAARHPGVRVVVTSRVIGYQRAVLDGAGFKHHMLQDLTEDLIAEFARRWYATACPHDARLAQSLVRRVTDAVAHSRPVRELAGNPLLLTILAIIGRRQTLPRDRQGVYKHAVTVLVAHWDRDAKQLTEADAPEALEVLGADERLELLRLLARRMQDGQGGIAGNHIHARDLEAVFREYLGEYELPPVQAKAAARAMVTQLRERNFILSRYGGEVYGFVHRAFLEYLAAADIAHRYKEDREWTPEELVTDVIVRRAGDPAWHEVILLVVGQLSERDAARAVDGLLDLHRKAAGRDNKMLVLAVRALAEVRKIKALAPQSRDVVDALRGAVFHSGHEGAAELETALPALATFSEYWTGRQHYLRWFHQMGQYGRGRSDAAAVAMALCPSVEEVHALVCFSPSSEVRRASLLRHVDLVEDPAELFALLAERAVGDASGTVRQVALKLLAERFSDNPDTFALLDERSVADHDENPRWTALKLLAGHFQGEPSTFTLLADRAVTDSHGVQRSIALQLLVEHFPDEPSVFALLTDRAVTDPEEGRRRTALELLAEHFPEAPDTFALLTARSVADPDENLRRTALELLAEHFQSGLNLFELLTERAVTGSRESTRFAALDELAQTFPDKPETFALLADRAIVDSHGFPRFMALRLLAEYFPSEPDAFTLITERAVTEPDEIVRQIVLSVLVDYFPNEPDTFALLTERVVTDPHGFPRTMLLQLLAEYFPDAPDTFTLLTARAVADPHSSPRRAAFELLAKHFPDAPDTFALLADRAVADPEESLRLLALQLLTQTYLDRPETLELVQGLVRDEPELAPRLWAYRAWAVASPVEDTYEIGQRALEDDHPDVRTGGAWILAFGCPEDPRTGPALRQHARSDPEEAVRAAASDALTAVGLLAPGKE